MPNLKISVMLGNLKMDPYEGMKKVVEMGVPGVHLSVDGGPFAPESLDKAARKKLLAHLRSLGLEVSAVSAWGGQVHLTEAEHTERDVAWAERNLEMAVDLDCRIWQGHIGVIPEDPEDEGWKTAVDAMAEIAAHGGRLGACLAIETGPEPPYVLKRLIETIGSEAIRINYDPANLVLWPAGLAQRAGLPYNKEEAIAKYQPIEGADVLGPYVVHTHAKDALVHDDGRRQEVPLGTGWIDWPRYVGLLRKHGFDGYFAIERETGEDPVGDITRAVDFLRTL
jgi:sugar phosphate isomerase/epimerase